MDSLVLRGMVAKARRTYGPLGVSNKAFQSCRTLWLRLSYRPLPRETCEAAIDYLLPLTLHKNAPKAPEA